MTKSDLTKKVADQTGHSEKETAASIATILDTMSQALVKGNGIEIRGFGSFKVKDYPGYTGRNPKTGEEAQVAPKKLPVFKVGKELRERV